MTAESKDPPPLSGVVVADLTRMLPGAVLARQLADLGARVIKIEDPNVGDPMRHSPPLRGNIGVGFSAFFRGTESVVLDLRTAADRRALKSLSLKVDVLVESFRPGRMAQWHLDPQQLHAENSRLIVCSLPGFPSGVSGPSKMTVGHDLNFSALAGALDRIGVAPFGVSGIQLADVTTGLLAAQAILAALLRRARSGRGSVITQPLAAGPLPFMLWSWADAAAGSSPSFTDGVLGGQCPAYSIYTCSDGKGLAVACLEPKFWRCFCERVEKPELAALGLASDARGREARATMAEHLRAQPVAHWLAAVEGEDLPVSPVNDLDCARGEPCFRTAGLLERLPLPDGTTVEVPGPSLPGLGAPPSGCAPRLGEHTVRVLQEFGIGEP